MISEEDARNTIEYGDYFVIQPESPWWSKEKYLDQNGGKKLPEGFSYNSQNNSKWLTVQELQEIIKEL
jgi:UDP-N-acetylglucosamine 4,6-dehydratase